MMTAAVRGSRRDRKEARHAEIIEAAFHEFAAHGFAATRLDDVAARVGVTKGSLYLYYASKEELFDAMVRQQITQTLIDDTPPGDATAATAAVQLAAVLRDYYDRYARDSRTRELLRLIIAEGGKFPDLIEFYHHEVFARVFAGLRRVLEIGVARGEFRAVAADSFVLVSFAPVLEAAIWRLVYTDRYPLDLDAHFALHCDLILNGLRTR